MADCPRYFNSNNQNVPRPEYNRIILEFFRRLEQDPNYAQAPYYRRGNQRFVGQEGPNRNQHRMLHHITYFSLEETNDEIDEYGGNENFNNNDNDTDYSGQHSIYNPLLDTSLEPIRMMELERRLFAQTKISEWEKSILDHCSLIRRKEQLEQQAISIRNAISCETNSTNSIGGIDSIGGTDPISSTHSISNSIGSINTIGSNNSISGINSIGGINSISNSIGGNNSIGSINTICSNNSISGNNSIGGTDSISSTHSISSINSIGGNSIGSTNSIGSINSIGTDSIGINSISGTDTIGSTYSICGGNPINSTNFINIQPSLSRKAKHRRRKKVKSKLEILQHDLKKVEHDLVLVCDKLAATTRRSSSDRVRTQEKINDEHAFASVRKQLENSITLEALQAHLMQQPSPDVIEHGYNTKAWEFTFHDRNSSAHIYVKLATDKTLFDRIVQRYVRDTAIYIGVSNEQHDYETRVRYFIRLMSSLPFIKFDHVTCEQLREKNGSYLFKKRMNQFSGTKFEDYMSSILPTLPSSYSYFAVDKNNSLLFIYLHDFAPKEEQIAMWQAALEFTITNNCKSPLARDPRHREDNGQAWHVFDWSMRGEPDSPCAAQDIIKGSPFRLETILKLTKSFHNTRLQLSSLLEVIDPHQHARYLHAAYHNTTEVYRHNLRACNQDVFLGCVLNNGQCKNHRDWSDVVGALSCMSPLGHFAGGNLVLPQLGVQLPYQPGNMVVCSTELLEHFVAPWYGYRFGMVHASRETSMRTTIPPSHKNVSPFLIKQLRKQDLILNMERHLKQETELEEIKHVTLIKKEKKKRYRLDAPESDDNSDGDYIPPKRKR
jgi:hypothetical protein